MMNGRLRRWIALAAVIGCAPAACVWLPDPPEPPDIAATQDDDLAEILFAEDADPAVAALDFVPDQLLVQPFSGADPDDVSDLYAGASTGVVAELEAIDATVLRVPPNRMITVATRLAESGLIETVQKNYLFSPNLTPSDPLFVQQPHLTQIGATRAWDTTVGSDRITIAVVDTGVDSTHPDLQEKIVAGWNAANDSSDFGDLIGHGTMVAGVAAAASNNQLGVTGVSWNSPILAVRVTDQDGNASAAALAAGILWSTANGARVINVSFAPLWSNRIVRAAAQQAFNRGALVVISAGNAGGTTESAGYLEALFVGGISSADRIAPFSDRGPFVDLVAPGVGVQSTKRLGEYGLASGTSFAAPIVSGTAALVWSVNPDFRPATVRKILFDTAADLGVRGKDATYGNGAVRAAEAVAGAVGAVPVVDVTAPEIRITRPSPSSILSRRFTVRASATDRWGVADVVLSVDGLPFATDTRSPYRFAVDPSRFSSGTHELSVVATDTSGNVSSARSVQVTFAASIFTQGQSRITFTSPRDGALVSGNVSLNATVSDADGLATVEWRIDGRSVFVTSVSGESTGVSFLWRSAEWPSGTHIVSLLALDAGGDLTTGRITLTTR